MFRVIVVLFVLGLIASALLGACGPIDVYAFRAIQYNFEAEETQNQVILLNIVRSSLHRPMEFTEITNIVGSNAASGSASFGFPVGPHPPSSITTGTAGASLSGSTTFTIPVLDTQDFYQGLLNDIQPSLLGYYLQTPFISKDLLLNLFVERIVVHVVGCPPQNHLATCERDFRNNPDNEEDIALFQMFVTYLQTLQVSAESIKESKDKTPTPTTSATTTHAGTATINVNASASATADTSGGGGKGTQYRLCFSPRASPDAVSPTATCGGALPKGKDQQIAKNTDVGGILFSRDLADIMLSEIGPPEHDTVQYIKSIQAFSGRWVNITLQFRSTGSIFNYLGQLVAQAQEGPPISLYAQPRFGPRRPQQWIPCWRTAAECRSIIAVHADGGPVLVSVSYAGSGYAVPGDPHISYSPDVFTILKQLIALNLSGKNLPTTAILSVTSP